MEDSLKSLAYLVDLMTSGICNICSKYHGNDACPMLLDTNFCCETQIVGDLQGKYYWEQNSYPEEQFILPYQRFQQSEESNWSRYNELNVYVADQYESLEVDPHSELKDIVEQMAVNNLQFQQDNLKFQQTTTASIKDLRAQVEQLVSTVHQIQENKMLHDNVQPIAPLEVISCDASLDETPGEPIEILFVSPDEHELSKKISSECMKEIIPKNSLKFDQDEFYTTLEIDKPLENFACECGVCDSCREINAAISGEGMLILTTTCAEIKENSINVECETRKVDFIHEQPFSIEHKLLVEPLIKTYNMQLSFNNCASPPPNLCASQAKYGFPKFQTFVITGLPYVKAIPPKPPDLSVMSEFAYYLLLPISYVRSAERPPPKPPDKEAAMQL